MKGHMEKKGRKERKGKGNLVKRIRIPPLAL